jgi:protein gp37
MGEITGIGWTDHSFNPWIGCARESVGCANCYADDQSARYGNFGEASSLWRRHGPRHITSDAYWRKPLAWDRQAAREGRQHRVFCASMADVFEGRADLDEPRARLWALIEATPHLDWQLLTKRPGNVAAMAPWGDRWPPNVWLGTSVENQRWADARIPVLRAVPAAVRFLSCEESIMAQCRAAGVPVFVKQDSGHRSGKQGRIPDELWIREFPAGGGRP